MWKKDSLYAGIHAAWTAKRCLSIFKKVTDILAKLKCTSFEMTYVGFLQFKYPAIFAKLYKVWLQGGQDHFFPKEMLISLSILKLHKNP